MTSIEPAAPIRVGLIGLGSIGRTIWDAVTTDPDSTVEIVGVLRRTATGDRQFDRIEDLLDCDCEVVVEAAGRDALIRFGPPLLSSGVDVLALSASAFADPAFERSVARAGPGRIHVSTGAIGGIDLLRAISLTGTLDAVEITSTTVPAAVVDVMPDIASASAPLTAASGSAREVATAFPRVANVASTLALATLGLDSTSATLIVDPSGTRKQHRIRAVAGASSFEATIDNRLSAANVATSAVTGFAALRALHDRQRRPLVL